MILTTYCFRVAGFMFAVCLPPHQDMGRLLPSFRPFHCTGTDGDEVIFRFTACTGQPEQVEEECVMEESVNDLGYVRLSRVADGYRVELRSTSRGVVHCLRADARFVRADAFIRWEDPYVGEAVSSLIRIVYAQAVIPRGGISLHASAVVLRGKAYLFMGKSGTGKSTHAALWLKHFPGALLLNDDNPTVRIEEDGSAVAYGTPWSGKTPCYRNLGAPVGGMARLRQAGTNRFVPQAEVEAFVAILPGCSVVRRDAFLHDALCDNVVRLAGRVKVGIMECRPDEAAARLCAASLGASIEERENNKKTNNLQV